MTWISEMVRDSNISRIIKWYPAKKYIVEEGVQLQMRDDIECGQDWWDIQVRGILETNIKSNTPLDGNWR